MRNMRIVSVAATSILEKIGHDEKCCNFRMRKIASLISASLLILTFIACTDDETNSDALKEQKKPLCEGGAELWIGFQRFAGMGDGGAGNTLFEENGLYYFVIDGACRFYAFDGTDGTNEFNKLADIRTGELSIAEAEDVATRLRVDRWPSHYDRSYDEPSLDCGGSVLFDDDGAFGCICGCPAFSEPSDINNAAETIVHELVSKGEPSTGPMRVVSIPHVDQCDGFESHYLVEEVTQDAPASFDPSEIAIPECSVTHNNATQSHVLEGEVSDDLRTMRQQYRTQLLETADRMVVNRISMRVGDALYDVYLRDFVPLEDANGLIEPHDTNRFTTVEP